LKFFFVLIYKIILLMRHDYLQTGLSCFFRLLAVSDTKVHHIARLFKSMISIFFAHSSRHVHVHFCWNFISREISSSSRTLNLLPLFWLQVDTREVEFMFLNSRITSTQIILWKIQQVSKFQENLYFVI